MTRVTKGSSCVQHGRADMCRSLLLSWLDVLLGIALVAQELGVHAAGMGR